jgi:hypothetical protein
MAPDLVALEELDPDDAVRLARSGALDRFPLVDAQVQDVLGRPFISAPAMVGAKETRMGGELAAGATAAPRP